MMIEVEIPLEPFLEPLLSEFLYTRSKFFHLFLGKEFQGYQGDLKVVPYISVNLPNYWPRNNS